MPRVPQHFEYPIGYQQGLAQSDSKLRSVTFAQGSMFTFHFLRSSRIGPISFAKFVNYVPIR